MKERRFVTGKDAQELLHFYRSAVRTRGYSDEAVSSKCSRKTAKICYTGRTERIAAHKTGFMV